MHRTIEKEKERTRWVSMEEKHEERLKDERNTEGVCGRMRGAESRWNRYWRGSLAQVNAHGWVYAYPCKCLCMCTCVLWHAYLLHTSFDHLPLLHTPQLLPHTWPHPAHPCRACRKNRDEKGNRFPPLWGAVTVNSSAQLRAFSSGQSCPAGPLQPPRGWRPLKWASRLQTPETCLCPAAAGGHWWLTPSLCLWTRHARDAELQLRKPLQVQQQRAMLCQNVSRCQRCLLHLETETERNRQSNKHA